MERTSLPLPAITFSVSGSVAFGSNAAFVCRATLSSVPDCVYSFFSGFMLSRSMLSLEGIRKRVETDSGRECWDMRDDEDTDDRGRRL